MSDLKNILNLLKVNRGFDFSGYRTSMLNRRIQKRIFATNSADLNAYKEYLEQNHSELDKLIDVLTINVSRFFRNTFSFEYFSDYILPNLISEKIASKDQSLRIWSAGCSTGEEPYSLAILIKEITEKEKLKISTTIIATDIDKNALKYAKKAVYPFEKIKNLKYHLLEKYFITQGNVFQLSNEIIQMVRFSEYDMLDKKTYVPPECIYGGFDIVLCRNVLIYFKSDFQEKIFNKLYRSLNENGILFLGEAEVPLEKLKRKLARTTKYCKIFKKR